MREPLAPLSSVDLAALVQLCNLKKVIQRNDGYGTGSDTIISSASAAMLKRRNLAVTGWSREMYPTKSGHAFVAGYARIRPEKVLQPDPPLGPRARRDVPGHPTGAEKKLKNNPMQRSPC